MSDGLPAPKNDIFGEAHLFVPCSRDHTYHCTLTEQWLLTDHVPATQSLLAWCSPRSACHIVSSNMELG